MRDLHTKNIQMNLHSSFNGIRPRYNYRCVFLVDANHDRLGAYIVDGRALTHMA
jgi:hypothetical protein